MASLTNPAGSPPAHITDKGLQQQISSMQKMHSPSAVAAVIISLPPVHDPPPQPLLLSLKGVITPIRSASMGIISRQVWKIALFIMKVIYTRLLAEPDMLPHCHLVKAQGSCLCSFSHFLAFCPSHTSHRHTSTRRQRGHL